MTLAQFQETVTQLLTTPEGHDAVQSTEALNRYIQSTPLSKVEQDSILRQPLGRLQQYDYMLRANVIDTLENIFPFVKQVLAAQWADVALDYFYAHPNTSYHLMRCAESMPDYLSSREDLLTPYPFLAELALVEWAEAELMSEEDAPYAGAIKNHWPQSADELSCWVPVANLESRLYSLNYDIGLIIEALKSDAPLPVLEEKPSPLMIYREPGTWTIRFQKLEPILAMWLDSVLATAELNPVSYSLSLEQLYAAIAEHLPINEADFKAQFLLQLPLLSEQKILLGSIAV